MLLYIRPMLNDYKTAYKIAHKFAAHLFAAAAVVAMGSSVASAADQSLDSCTHFLASGESADYDLALGCPLIMLDRPGTNATYAVKIFDTNTVVESTSERTTASLPVSFESYNADCLPIKTKASAVIGETQITLLDVTVGQQLEVLRNGFYNGVITITEGGSCVQPTPQDICAPEYPSNCSRQGPQNDDLGCQASHSTSALPVVVVIFGLALWRRRRPTHRRG